MYSRALSNMAYTGTIVTEAEIALMAGENVDATGDTEENHNILAAQAEAYLCCLVKYDIVTNWANLSTIYKAMFTEYAARYCAMQLIFYNTAGYSSIAEAEDMASIHFYRMRKIEQILNKEGAQNFLGI
jgi:hypothetical protein